ncbi:hypothetical protein AAE478_007851 [Parahypoxylon ruwenzoriense]
MPLLSGRSRLQSAAGRSRGRQSTSSSAAHKQQNDDGGVLTELPDYEPLSYPLNAEAIRSLAQLSTNKDMRKYEDHLNSSLKLLSASVRDLNDKYVARKDNLKALQEKRGENGEKNDRERAEEKALLALQDDVPLLTDDCDLAVRSVIDLKVEVEDNREALKKTAGAIEREGANAAQRRRTRGHDDEDDDMVDVNILAPLTLLSHAQEAATADYATKSLYEKYGVNNDYIGFKRLWHDAVHASDGKPLPDASKWFTQNGGDGEEDSDEDLIVAEEHLDIHCPLSMAVMEDPYTSTKCKHTFEKASIVQFLRGRPGGRARCPQTGCNKEVSISDFHPDPVMLRRIKRRLAAQQESMADDDDEEEEDGVDGDTSTDVTSARKIKLERKRRSTGRQSIDDIEDVGKYEEDEED